MDKGKAAGSLRPGTEALALVDRIHRETALPQREVLRRAGIDGGNVRKWKRGAKVRIGTLDKLEALRGSVENRAIDYPLPGEVALSVVRRIEEQTGRTPGEICEAVGVPKDSVYAWRRGCTVALGCVTRLLALTGAPGGASRVAVAVRTQMPDNRVAALESSCRFLAGLLARSGAMKSATDRERQIVSRIAMTGPFVIPPDGPV